jgi:hypothetical protein
MFKAMTQQAREVMTLAAEESRRLRHAYVGTEHILLALTLEPSFAGSGVLARLRLDADAVRARVEELVQAGPREQVSSEPANQPLTPRATLAIQMASDEAASVSLPLAGPEHLLIGLIREPSGVAGRVMRDLGLDEQRVRVECLLVRMRQMQVVERSVRPVRASTKRKRRMREELLAHLTAVCEEEQQAASGGDALAALDHATRRFGDPAQLARELQTSVPPSERFAWHVEHWLGWRAPETVLRMLLRTSFISFCILAFVAAVSIVAEFLFSGGRPNDVGFVLRIFLAMALLIPAAQFGFGWCYYKARDSLWGVFGSRRSLAKATTWSVAAGGVVFLCGLGFIFGVEGDPAALFSVRLPSNVAVALAAAMTCALLAQTRGPIEIRDTTWSLLPVDTAS